MVLLCSVYYLLSNGSGFLGKEIQQEYIVAFALTFLTQKCSFMVGHLIFVWHFCTLLIKGEVKFWWDSIFSLALPQILLNRVYHQCHILMVFNKICVSLDSINLSFQKIFSSKGFLWLLNITRFILFSTHLKATFVWIWSNDNSIIK